MGFRRYNGPGMHGVAGVPLASYGGGMRPAPVTQTYGTSQDTRLSQAAPTFNYGIAPSFSAVAATKGLLKFDLSAVASSATCLSATLYLYQVATGAALAWTATAYSVAIGNTAWIAGTKNGALAGAGEPCWNALAADGAGGVTTAWAGSAGMGTAGTDYEAGAIGTFSGNRSNPDGTEYTCTLTASRVQGWFGATNTNYGIVLWADALVGGFGLIEFATTAYRPKLIVTYQE